MLPVHEPGAVSEEGRLAETLAHYRHMAEFSLDGIIITDLSGRVLITNPAVLEIFEIDSHAASHPLTVFDFIAPDSIDCVQTDFASIRADRNGIVRTYKAKSARGNGIWIEVLANRITFEGEPANIISVRDVTGHREIEESLRRNEEKYRLIAENSPDIITSLTPDLVVNYISPAVETVLGYTPAEVSGESILLFIHQDDRHLIRSAGNDVAGGRDTVNIEFRILHKNGHFLWFETTSQTVRNEGTGRLLEFYNVSRDITGRKEAEEIAHRRDRVLHGFATASGFLLTGRLKDPIPRVLGTIGEAMDADVAYICEEAPLTPGGEHRAVRHRRWGREPSGNGIHRICGQGPGFPPAWSKRLASGVWISACRSRVGEEERAVLRDLGIQSILLVPVFVSGAYWGFIGVSDLTRDRVWADSEIEILMTLAATLGLVFERRPEVMGEILPGKMN
jgi:PAS domain S-box-containing protein